MAPDIHTPNKDNTAENDVQNVTKSSITNNANNTSETERSKKSRKLSHNATTPFFVNRYDMRYKKILPENFTSEVLLHVFETLEVLP